MYAVIETGGKQLVVKVGESIFVEKLEGAEGDEIVFDKVLVVGGDKIQVGTPYVEGATVNAKVEKQGKDRKIQIHKWKSKNGSSHRRQGHRQPYTKLVIETINI
ncbi:MAG: 50S ribosomal protein L21 [Erysipelothrix sp.]|nr:50S ribosomal protein L21 [Erysipelothrix sp.]